MTHTEQHPRKSDTHTGPVVERINTRGADVGGLPIHRALPTSARRMVGAWCFMDHAGPVDANSGHGLHVGPHPHIGLQTFTWMIEGEIMHRDTLGYEQLIRPGQVNLMTAGRGIAHAEDEASPATGRLHAVQLWIALPEAERHRPPAFQHYPILPIVDQGGFRVTVLVGEAFGQHAAPEVYSPLVGMDFTASDAARVVVPLQSNFEYAVLVLSGEARIEGEALEPDTLLYLGSGREQLDLQCSSACRLVLIGGEPFGEEILLWWNFVARRPEEMEEATAAWNEHRHFGEVKGSPSPRLVAPPVPALRQPAPPFS
ncbi:pirin family protein [Pinirhizobacter soli]|uniref:pirin family protein n=1 Tax=Pinirhizobacter soli TaxID=2786953 RepID=UPI00202A933A|nr:pirin family protein [Pinirhizobacter soli]